MEQRGWTTSRIGRGAVLFLKAPHFLWLFWQVGRCAGKEGVCEGLLKSAIGSQSGQMMLLQSNFFPGGLGVWIWMLGKRPGVKLWTLLWCCLSPNRYTYMQNSPLHKRFNFHPGRARSKKWTAQIQKCISIYFKNVFGKLNYSYLRT